MKTKKQSAKAKITKFNYLAVNTTLSNKKVIIIPVNGDIVKSRGNKHQLYDYFIYFNEFTNTLNTTITESELNSKLDSKAMCYLFVNNGKPSAFINGKLLNLERVKPNAIYTIAQVYLEVLQGLKDLKDKGISLEIKSIVLYESMIYKDDDKTEPIYSNIRSKSRKQGSSSHIYETPTKNKNPQNALYESAYRYSSSDNYIELNPISNNNSAYESRPGSPSSLLSLKRTKSKKSLRRKSQPTAV